MAKSTYNLQKSGNRYYITVPKSVVETKGWESGMKFSWSEISTQELRLTKE